MEVAGDEYGKSEALSSFFQNEKKYKEGLKREKNKLDFYDKEKDKLEEYKVEESEMKDEAGHKVFSCTVKGQSLVGDGTDDWKLKERSDKYRFIYARINEQWLLVSKSGRPSRRIER